MSKLKVFISGDTGNKSLTKNEMDCIKQIIENGHTILIGDSFGLERKIQKLLIQLDCHSVTVYFSGKNVRNNLGNWQTKQIVNTENLTGKTRYRLKDKTMIDDCDSAMLFWDDKSDGLETIIKQLNELKKYYLILSRTGLDFGFLNKINNMIIL